MGMDAYAAYLRENGVDDEGVRMRTAAVEAFEAWLSRQNAQMETAGKGEAGRYARHLIGTPANTPETYDALCEYAAWRGLRAMYIAFVEITDCYGAMETLRDTIGDRHGADIRDQVFAEPVPPLGADEAERLRYTQRISGRMNELLPPADVRAAWFQVQHGIPKAFWEQFDEKQRTKFGACGSPEALVDALVTERTGMLTRLHGERKLWFTQEITDDAFRYLLQNPYLQMGERNGRMGIVVTKVPYMTDKALHAQDDRHRRYFTCHCPLIREAILRGETLPDDVCYCSLGHASHFLAGLGLEGLEGEVLESAVKGDMRCRFIFYLPNGDTP